MLIQFNQELYREIPKEVITKEFGFLVETFKEHYVNLFPMIVYDLPTLIYLLHLSKSLQNIQGCKGYAEHVNEYRNNVDSTYFVTALANYFISKGAQVALEPVINRTAESFNKTDILVRKGGRQAYVECKSPRQEICSQLDAEHEMMYSIIVGYITRPCDLSITYEGECPAEKVHRLGAFLSRKLQSVRGEGTILNAEGVKVDVSRVRGEWEPKGDIKICRLWENYYNNELVPGTLINRNGRGVMLLKQGISLLNNIEHQLRRAKDQASVDAPFILVIHSADLPGRVGKIVEDIASMFNPNKYRRFTAVTLARFEYKAEGTAEFTFHFIPNPFAHNPASWFYELLTTPGNPPTFLRG